MQIIWNACKYCIEKSILPFAYIAVWIRLLKKHRVGVERTGYKRENSWNPCVLVEKKTLIMQY